MSKLTLKQRLFAHHYLVSLDATRAARLAGYSPKTATQQGSRLLRNVHVAALVAERQKRIAAKLEVTQESIVAELAKIAFANMGDFVTLSADGASLLPDFSRVTRQEMAAVTTITVDEFSGAQVRHTKLQLHNKVAALTTLAKHLGMFTKAVKLDFSDPARELIREISGQTFRPKELSEERQPTDKL